MCLRVLFLQLGGRDKVFNILDHGGPIELPPNGEESLRESPGRSWKLGRSCSDFLFDSQESGSQTHRGWQDKTRASIFFFRIVNPGKIPPGDLKRQLESLQPLPPLFQGVRNGMQLPRTRSLQWFKDLIMNHTICKGCYFDRFTRRTQQEQPLMGEKLQTVRERG